MSWFWFFMETVETKSEMTRYIEEFEAWLNFAIDNMEVTVNCSSFVNEYWKSSFKPNLHKLCQCYFHQQVMGQVKTSIYSEVENSRLKRSSFGTRPNLTIDAAQDAIANVSKSAISSIERQSSKNLTASATKPNIKNVTAIIESKSQVDFSFDGLCEKSLEMIVKQHQLSTRYIVLRVRNDDNIKTFMV